jgi:predicted Zn-ribbon and HTH transcriptional regulator
MARIVYKPHCSKCGAVINDDVVYETITLPLDEDSLFNHEYTNIYPARCKTCGEYFDCIEITPPMDLTKEKL